MCTTSIAKTDDKHARQDARAKKVIERQRERQEKRRNGLPPFLVVSGWLLKILSKPQYNRFQSDIDTIKGSFALYYGENSNALNLTNMIYSHCVARIMIGHIVKYNPGVFDKMIMSPETVTDPETQSYIISGHLRNHPNDAGKVIEKFKPWEIEPHVYTLASRYAKRLKAAEKCR